MDFPNSSDVIIETPYSSSRVEPRYYKKREDRQNGQIFTSSPIITYSSIDSTLNIIKKYNNNCFKLPSKRVLLVSREEWGAKPAHWKNPYHGKIKYVFYTSTRTTSCWSDFTCKARLVAKQESHMSRRFAGQDDIGYNFVIGGDGNVYVGRGWHSRPDIPRQYRSLCNSSLLIAFVGRFHYEPPTDDMIRSANKLIKDEDLPPYPDSLQVVPRSKWGAQEPTWDEPPPVTHPLQFVRVTNEGRLVCLDVKRCSYNLQKLQRKSMDEEGLDDIPYNFIIGETGLVFEGRGWFTDASRDVKYNYVTGKGIDIALVGHYDYKKHRPPRSMVTAMEELIEYGKENGLLAKGYKEISLNN